MPAIEANKEENQKETYKSLGKWADIGVIQEIHHDIFSLVKTVD